MTLTQFKYVLEIDKTGSINQAANNLFISQSVLSTALKALETELGEKLFFRSARGIQTTPFGKNFIAYITPIQLQMNQLNNLLLRTSETYTSSLSIACTGLYYMSEIYASLLEKYRDFKLRIEAFDTSLEETMNMLYNQTVDFGLIRRWSCYHDITAKRLRSFKLNYFHLATYDMGITVGPKNPLFQSESDCITSDMLRDYPCVMYGYLDAGPYTDIFEQLKISLSGSRIVTNSRATVYEMISNSTAYYLDSVIPSMVQDEVNFLKHGGKFLFPRRTLRLANCNVKTEYGWLKRKDKNCTQLEEEVIDLITEWIR